MKRADLKLEVVKLDILSSIKMISTNVLHGDINSSPIRDPIVQIAEKGNPPIKLI